MIWHLLRRLPCFCDKAAECARQVVKDTTDGIQTNFELTTGDAREDWEEPEPDCNRSQIWGEWELGHEFRPGGAALGVQRIARIIARVRIILWIVVPQYRHLRSRGRRVSVFFLNVVNQMVLPIEGLVAAWV